MARPVLAPISLLTAALSLSLCYAAPARGMQAAKAASCSSAAFRTAPADRQKQVRDFERATRVAPFFKEMSARFGAPRTCELAVEGTRITLTFTFPGQGRLFSQSDPTAELAEQRMTLPARSSPRMTEKQAITLLKTAEKASFGPEGCGIDWSGAPESSEGELAETRQAIYRGKACNCQGRLVYRGNLLVELILSSAC